MPFAPFNSALEDYLYSSFVVGLKVETLEEWRNNFVNDGKLRLAQNVCTKQGPLEACRHRAAEQAAVPHIFNHKVEQFIGTRDIFDRELQSMVIITKQLLFQGLG